MTYDTDIRCIVEWT